MGARAGPTLGIFKPSFWRVSAFLVPARVAQIWLGESGGRRVLWQQGRARTAAGGQHSVTFKGLQDELHYRLAIGITSGLAFSWTWDSGCLVSHRVHAQPRGASGTEGGLLSLCTWRSACTDVPEKPQKELWGKWDPQNLVQP